MMAQTGNNKKITTIMLTTGGTLQPVHPLSVPGVYPQVLPHPAHPFPGGLSRDSSCCPAVAPRPFLQPDC